MGPFGWLCLMYSFMYLLDAASGPSAISTKRRRPKIGPETTSLGVNVFIVDFHVDKPATFYLVQERDHLAEGLRNVTGKSTPQPLRYRVHKLIPPCFDFFNSFHVLVVDYV